MKVSPSLNCFFYDVASNAFAVSDYPLNQTDFMMPDTEPNGCLVCDKRYGGRYHLDTLKDTGFERCKRVCKASPNCLGFDFYVPANDQNRGTCVLSRVDLPILRNRLGKDDVEVGAKPDDLREMAARKCIRFYRVRVEGRFIILKLTARNLMLNNNLVPGNELPLRLSNR